jgi:uncharacterized RDD family membrane protein YckC
VSAGPEPPDGEQRYVGLVTRAIAFAIDAAVIDVVALVVGVAAALILSVLHLPKDLKTVLAVLGGVAYVLWSIGYFVGFWSTTGQTPGASLMRFRVVPTEGGTLKPRRGVVRCIGLVLAALPLFAGYVLILFDRRRRGFQDRLARTLVVEAPELSPAELRRTERRATRVTPRSRGHLDHTVTD